MFSFYFILFKQNTNYIIKITTIVAIFFSVCFCPKFSAFSMEIYGKKYFLNCLIVSCSSLSFVSSLFFSTLVVFDLSLFCV